MAKIQTAITGISKMVGVTPAFCAAVTATTSYAIDREAGLAALMGFMALGISLAARTAMALPFWLASQDLDHSGEENAVMAKQLDRDEAKARLKGSLIGGLALPIAIVAAQYGVPAMNKAIDLAAKISG